MLPDAVISPDNIKLPLELISQLAVTVLFIKRKLSQLVPIVTLPVASKLLLIIELSVLSM